MKLSKSKSLIGLAIVLALLVGMTYLFLQVSGAQQPEAEMAVSTAAQAPEQPDKPLPPEHQLPSPVLTSPGTPHEKRAPEHQLPALVASKPAITKEAGHEESEVPVYQGPTLATGDDCTDPIVVSLPAALPYSDLSQTTCGRNNDYTETCLSGYDGGEDIIYELTVTSAVDVDITMNPKGTTWTGMALDNTCPPGDPCMAYDRASSGTRTLTGIHLEPGTYYIMIDTWPSPDCIPDFDLTIVEAAPPPPNDDCVNAEAIGDVTGHPWSTTLASFDGGGTCMTSPNIWYCYTATCTGDVTVSLCGSDFDTKLAVYEGCECDPLGAEIDCNDDCCGTRSQITFAGVSGNQYLIEVGGYSSNTGDGILTISCHTPGAPPANDECTGAVAISVPDCPAVNTVYGTTKDATVDCPGVLDWTAVWYEFELTYAYNKVLIDYCPTNDPRVDTRGVVLYDECPPDCENYILYTDYSWVTCPSGYSDLTVWWEDLPAGTYYLPVYVVDCDENGMDFGFDICVEEMAGPQPGDNCDNPIVASLNKGDGDTLYMDLGQTTCGRVDYYDATCLGYYDGGEDIIYELTVSTAVRVNITLDPKTTTYTGICIDAVCPPDDACIGLSTNSSASPHGITNVDLDPGIYYIMIDTWPSPDCIDSFDLVITEVGVGPPNDDCEDAITLYPPDCPDEQVVDGTTIGAGIDCPGFLDWPAVWYTFELTYDCNDLFIDFCEMDIDLSSVGAVIYDECPPVCDDPIYYTEGAYVDCPNGTYNAQLWYKNLPPGTYWLPIYVKDTYDNEYLNFSFGICVEECPPPEPGDNCDFPLVVNLNKGPGDTLYLDQNQTTCGRVDDYENTCLGSYDGGEDIIYQINVSSAVDVDIKMDPKGTSWTGLAIDVDCPPGDPCMAYSTGSSGSRLLPGVHLEPGTYYIMVDTWPSPDCIPDFDLVITEAAGGPENDDCADATPVGEVTDLAFSTTAASFDGQGSCQTAPNIWYLFTSPCTQDVTVSLCGSEYDTKLAVYDGSSCDPLSPEIECNDDYCGLQSQITFAAVEGNEYLIEVGGYSSNTGDGILNIYCVVPCVVECPPGGYDEGEGYCYDDYDDTYNGGCNSTPFVFQEIACGDTICGSCGVFDFYGSTYRDMDWFAVQCSEGDLTLTCVAEFPLALWLFDAGFEDCVDLVNLDFINTTGVCDTLSVSAYVTSGTYLFIIAPMDWGSYPCGPTSEYVAWVECQPFGPQIAVDPPEFDLVLNPDGDCSTADEDLLISSVGGEDLDYSIVENPAVDWMELSSYSGTIPPGNSHTLTTSFDATGMAAGDYYCDLEITHNDPGVPSPLVVPVHLTVELAPEIDVAPRLWMPVVPGCIMDQGFRVSNLGEGVLRFEVSVTQNPPPLMARDDDAWENLLQTQWSEPKHRPANAPVAKDGTPPARTPQSRPESNLGSGKGMTTPKGDVILSEGFEGAWPPTDWTIIETHPATNWIQEDYDYHTGAYSAGIWWDYGHQDEWLITPELEIAGPCTLTFWTYGFRGSIYEDHYYVKVSTDGGANWDVLMDLTDSTGGWNYYDFPYSIGLDAYAGQTVNIAWHAEDPPNNDGLWYIWLIDDVSVECFGPGCPFTVYPEEGDIPAESFFDVTLTFDGTLFTECVDETLICYLVFTSNDCDEPVVTVDVLAMSARGDVTGDCVINIGDVVFLLNYVFAGGPAPDPLCIGDVDRDGDVDSDDALYLVSYLFTGGPPPEIPTAPKADEETIDIETVNPIEQTPIQRK